MYRVLRAAGGKGRASAGDMGKGTVFIEDVWHTQKCYIRNLNQKAGV